MARSKEFDPARALDKAMRLFWRSGYENTSLEALLKEMGIAKQSLYDTFGDKTQPVLEGSRLLPGSNQWRNAADV
jgi:TetR/AcrR family transcriptional repressor of nem operon